jgi:hypothetical protein
LNLTWTLNSFPVGQNDGITVMKMKRFSSLSIDSVQAVHAGKYTCTAANLAGSTSYSAYLNVNGTPFYCLLHICDALLSFNYPRFF